MLEAVHLTFAGVHMYGRVGSRIFRARALASEKIALYPSENRRINIDLPE